MIAIQLLTGISPDHLMEDPDTGEVVWRQYAPTVSDSFAEVLQIMVRYDFRQRYPNAGEAFKALSAIADPSAMAPTQAINAPNGMPNALSATVVSPEPPQNVGYSPSVTPPTVLTPSQAIPPQPVSGHISGQMSGQQIEPIPLQGSDSIKKTQLSSNPLSQNPWVIVAAVLAAVAGAAVVTFARLPNQETKAPELKSPTTEKSVGKGVDQTGEQQPTEKTADGTDGEPETSSSSQPTSSRSIPKNSAPQSTPQAPSKPNSPFIQVEIRSTQPYRHRSGLFTMNIPTGWDLQDGSKPGEVIQLWFDPSKNALIGVDIFSAPPGMSRDQLVSALQTFLRNTFGNKSGFFMREPVPQADGSSLIVWGFKEQIQGVQGEILGNSFIEQKGDKVSVLTTGVLSEQYERLKPEYEKIINSYRINPLVPVP